MAHVATVLVIDDDEGTRQALRMALEGEGYQVLESPDGQSGLKHLRTHPKPLIVLLDWLMPGMDGVQVLEAMVTDTPATHRHTYILMSASAENPQLLSLRMLTDLDVTMLGKPFDADQLLLTVAAAAASLAKPTRRR
jgi:CheY-like chemotaxis protein